MYSCKILADSINVCGNRLTTFEITYPRIVLAEYNTHRMLSRNAASSRAIPTKTMLARILADPFMPVYWGKNQSGMQAAEELEGIALDEAKNEWLLGLTDAVKHVNKMIELGVHKQIVNRLLEPWMWVTNITSATEWDNFFFLRCHPDAQPEIRKIADMMKDAYDNNTPKLLQPGEWHLPLIGFEGDEQLTKDEKIMVSAGRCARVSYLTHDGKRDVSADIGLNQRLIDGPHMSPLEHQAEALDNQHRYGNFIGWQQYRKTIPNENYGKELI